MGVIAAAEVHQLPLAFEALQRLLDQIAEQPFDAVDTDRRKHLLRSAVTTLRVELWQAERAVRRAMQGEAVQCSANASPDKLHLLALRMQALIDACAQHLRRLEQTLDALEAS